MNWESIFTSLLTSGIVSSSIGVWLIRHQKKLDFEYDYKKYVLKKRQEAYERTEKVINRLSEKEIHIEHPGFNVHKIFIWDSTKSTNPTDLIFKFISDLESLAYDFIWLSDKMIKDLELLVEKLKKYEREAAAKNRSGPDFIYFGMEKFKELETLRATIYFDYFDDLKELDRIDKFIKEKTLI